MIIIPMCKLTKIFVPELQNDLLKDPARVHSEEPFTFKIRTSKRDYVFEYNSPRYEHDEILFNWLTGGNDGLQNQETNWTGLVNLDLDSVQNGQILAAVAGISKINSNTQKDIEEAKIKAALLSEQRVMQQIRNVHKCMLLQFEANREQAKEIYSPSATEYLCAYVLADEQKKNTEEKKKIQETFADLMRKTFT
jgi:hypothetical protein